MKASLVLLLLFLALTGCIPPRINSADNHYDVYIDPSFRKEQHESVVNALIEWQLDTNETVTFDIINNRDTPNPLITILASDSAYLHKHHHSTTVGAADYRGVDTNILIDIATSQRDFHQIALHEIGHALGLDHNDDPKAVMYEWTNDAASYLTCKDMIAFCEKWNCNAMSFTLCHVVGIGQ